MAEQLEGYPLPYEGDEVQQLLNKVRNEAWNAPVNVEKQRAESKEAELQANIAEVLLRAQGMSENYRGDEDPILRKIFGGAEYDKYGDDRRNAIVKAQNEWLDTLHTSDGQNTSIPRGMIHLDQDGSCLWLFNAPISFAEDVWLQISLNGVVSKYKITIDGETVERQWLEITSNNNLWQRMHRNGKWEDWSSVTITQSQVSNLITTALEGYMPNFDPTVKGHLSFDGNVSLMSNGDSGDLFLMNEDNTGRGNLFLNNIFPNGGGSLVDAIRRIKNIEAFLAQKLGYQP